MPNARETRLLERLGAWLGEGYARCQLESSAPAEAVLDEVRPNGNTFIRIKIEGQIFYTQVPRSIWYRARSLRELKGRYVAWLLESGAADWVRAWFTSLEVLL